MKPVFAIKLPWFTCAIAYRAGFRHRDPQAEWKAGACLPGLLLGFCLLLFHLPFIIFLSHILATVYSICPSVLESWDLSIHEMLRSYAQTRSPSRRSHQRSRSCLYSRSPTSSFRQDPYFRRYSYRIHSRSPAVMFRQDPGFYQRRTRSHSPTPRSREDAYIRQYRTRPRSPALSETHYLYNGEWLPRTRGFSHIGGPADKNKPVRTFAELLA